MNRRRREFPLRLAAFFHRGGWWVLAQTGLFALYLLLPAWPGWKPLAGWPEPLLVCRAAGLAGMAAGAVLFLSGLAALGRSLSSLPYPLERGRLVARGAYRLVRHPIYGGLLLAAAGWAGYRASLAHLAAGLVLLAFFLAKARLEERLLAARFPGYAEYARRVRRRFIPWIH